MPPCSPENARGETGDVKGERPENMGRDNAHGGAEVGWDRTGGEAERTGTHTAGQGSGGIALGRMGD